jgi:hypothetical protein
VSRLCDALVSTTASSAGGTNARETLSARAQTVTRLLVELAMSGDDNDVRDNADARVQRVLALGQ